MLSDEEKEVVNMIKTGLEVSVECQIIEQIHLNRKEAQTVLNLIKKQSKEIEELNKSDTSKEQSSMNYYNLYKELIDKIKAKIEVLEKLDFGTALVSQFTANLTTITILQSLLEKE